MDLNYVEAGEGFPLLLIHGFCNDLTLWDDILEDLAKEYRVITIDLPGHGKSPMIDDPVDFPRVAEVVQDFLNSLGITEYIAIGHSMGGYVVSTLVENYPDQVVGFGLYHSTPFQDAPKRRRGREESIRIVQREGMGSFIESFIPFLFFYERIEELMPKIDRATKMAMGTSADTHISFTQAMRDRKDRSNILALEKPKLIVIGDHDSAVPVEASLKMKQQAKHAQVVTMENTGHMGMMEWPEQATEIITSFVEDTLRNRE